MFDNTLRKYLGRKEQVLQCLEQCGLQRSHSHSELCRWHRYDHSTVLEELMYDSGDVPELNNN